MRLPRFPWSPLAVVRRFAFLTIFLLAITACSDSSAGPDLGNQPTPGSMTPGTGTLRVRADNPTVLPGDTIVLRATAELDGRTVPADVTWRSLDGGDVIRTVVDSEPVTAFTSTSVGRYRLVGKDRMSPAADTAIITVASEAVRRSITALEIRPDSASIQLGDTLRFAVWGRTAKGDSIAAPVELSAQGGQVRGLDYIGTSQGSYEINASVPGTAVSVKARLIVTAVVPQTSDSAAQTILARIVLTPGRDTISTSDTLRFHAYGLTRGGDSVPVPTYLLADSGQVRGMTWVSSKPGVFRVRAKNLAGTLSDTSWVTVRSVTAPATSSPPATSTPTTPIADSTSSTPTAPVDTTVPPAAPVTSGSGPELPRVSLDTRYVPPTGKTISVAAGGDLQAAINLAQRGDVIELAAGARFVGNYALPAKTGTGWITIRSAGTLPPEGTRVTPQSAANFARIVSGNAMPAIYTRTSGSTSYYRLMGLDLTSQASMTYAIVNLGDYDRVGSSVGELPQWIVLDRVYIHGTPQMKLQRCVTLNSRSSAVIDSWLSDCHEQGTDAQAIISWSSPGPFKIENNHLEGSGENIMFGGADPTIAGVVPSDITIRRNHVVKPLSWKGVWTAKNLLEIKNAQRVLVENNVFENNWADGQTGFAIVFKSVNQQGGCNWCVAQDLTFRSNMIINSPGGFNMAAQQNESGGTSIPSNDILITNNVFQGVGQASQSGSRILFQLLGALRNLQIVHNTGFSEDKTAMFDGVPTAGLIIRDNLFSRGQYGVFGSGHGEGTSALSYYAPDGIFRGNVLVAAPTSLYPASNYYPATDLIAGIINSISLGGSSPYLTGGTDGRAPGADAVTVTALLGTVR